MNQPTYDQLVAKLFPRLTGGIRWGLDRTRRLLAAVGDPQRSFRTVHVGGTNGKGSVAACIDSVLRADGRKTALYSSPHLCSFRERVRIDGVPISEQALIAAAAPLWPRILEEDASFFEATTVIAFLAMAQAGVEIATVEVGLGGRLDSTNVVEPDVVVLTNVSLDHVQLLGPTIERVAAEKAGIIKARVPVVTGETAAPARDVFSATARRMAAPIDFLRDDALSDVRTSADGTVLTVHGTRWSPLRLHSPLPGAHQALNAALAVRAIDRLPDAPADGAIVARGIATTRWAGRLQRERRGGVDWLFDVAHNVAGVEVLVSALASLRPARPLIAVMGVLGDKDWRSMLGPLHEVTDRLLLTTPPTAPTQRRWDPAQVIAGLTLPRARIVDDLVVALEEAHAAAAAGNGSVLVTGSFHTVGDALASLRLCEVGSDVAVRAPAFL